MPKLIVAEIAKKKGISQYRLQLDSKLSPPTVRRYWRDEVTAWDKEVMTKLAEVLGVEVRELIRNGDHAETTEPDETTETTETGEE